MISTFIDAKGRAMVTALLGMVAVLTAGLAFATPAAANDAPWGHIHNHTGRTLVGAFLNHKGGTCTVWNNYDDDRPKSGKYSCATDYIDPHTNTAIFTDFDAVRVRSSNYYYVRFYFVYGENSTYLTPYHKTLHTQWTKFPDNGVADCYSGTHVHCTITVVY